MTLNQRAYRGQSDWQAVADLIQSDPYFYHQIDFPWRLCSTSLENYQNAAVWEDEQGHMRVFAALQFPWLTFDYAIHPEVRNLDLEIQVIAWAETRLRAIAHETNDEFPFNISVYADEQERIALLEAQGYTRWENHIVVMSRPLDELPVPKIPAGFTIRPLAGEQEIEQYAALQRLAFDSTTMTPLWRSHTLHAPLYNPELDLVAVSPDGQLVGFCICWYQPALKTAQIEPLGVHPDFQQLGLSQALMAENFRRAANIGAESIRVETYSFSQPALKAYETAGFQVINSELKFYKEYRPDNV
ncbi:MAG TPA: N-acetyltransferase [Phototrophicaceae bacterium]|jgi:ribosomal protein S18 acetylase RimI-like enzyme|nr:N-acetyltransferase [Phototrophicaceae bacterium]